MSSPTGSGQDQPPESGRPSWYGQQQDGGGLPRYGQQPQYGQQPYGQMPRFPGGDEANMPTGAQRGPMPATLRWAVNLMFVSALLETVGVLLSTLLIGQSSHTKSHTSTAANLATVVVIVIVIAGLWVWMGFAHRAGQGWARIVGTVLFGINTVATIAVVGTGGVKALGQVVAWLISVAIVVLVWHRASRPYFDRSTAGPRY